MSRTTPNLLLIQVDQLTPGALPFYGGSAKTPHLERLAAESVVFDSAYSNFPLCAPSRFSMLSGRLASEVGAYDNAAEFPASVPTFVHYLRAAGYHTALCGKMHFIGPDQLHGYDERLTTDLYPSTFVWTFDPASEHEEFANDIRAFTSAGVVLRNPQIDFDEEVAHQATGKLFDLARGRGLKGAQPWHLTVSFTHPHPPYQCRPEFWNLYRDDEVPIPRSPACSKEEADPYSRRLRREVGLHEAALTEEQIRSARHAYYGAVSYVDDRIGKLLQTLRETGLDRDTVVVFTADHGDMLGERGLWYKKCFYEGACRVPLLVSAPDRFPPGRISHNVSLVDLLPTFVDLAARAQPPEPIDPLDGTTLIPLLEDGSDRDRRDAIYAENLAEGTVSPILMVKSGSLKFVSGGGGAKPDPDQLFDLATDREEQCNLACNPEYESVTAELRGLMHRRWDLKGLQQAVQASQSRRLFLRGLGDPAWNFEAANASNARVLRDGTKYNEWNYGGMLRVPDA